QIPSKRDVRADERARTERPTRLGEVCGLALPPGRAGGVGKFLGAVVVGARCAGLPLLGRGLLLRATRAGHWGPRPQRRRAPGCLVDQAADLGSVDGLLLEQGAGHGVEAGSIPAQRLAGPLLLLTQDVLDLFVDHA